MFVSHQIHARYVPIPATHFKVVIVRQSNTCKCISKPNCEQKLSFLIHLNIIFKLLIGSISITENINFYKFLLIQYELFLSNIFRERPKLRI